MSIRYAKKPISDHLKPLRDSALSSALRIGKAKARIPEGMEPVRARLSDAAALFLHAKDAFFDGDEPAGAVFESVAVIEIVRAAISAAEAIEAGAATDALPGEFVELCEEYGVCPVSPLGGEGVDSSELRSSFYEEYFLTIDTLFYRDGRPGATLLQASSGVTFERAFGRGVIAYSDGRAIPLFGIAAEVIGEVIDGVEDCAAL